MVWRGCGKGGGSGEGRCDCEEGGKGGKVGLRGEELLKEREKWGWGIGYGLV